MVISLEGFAHTTEVSVTVDNPGTEPTLVCLPACRCYKEIDKAFKHPVIQKLEYL